MVVSRRQLALLRRNPILALPIVVVVLLLLVAVWRPILSPLVASIADRGVAARAVRIDHDGRSRTYWLHRPSQAPPGPAPLLLVLHGVGQSPRSAARVTGFSQIADREGFAVAYPEAVDGVWSFGDDIGDQDDVGFLTAVVDHLDANDVVDRSRVFMTGISAGGMMAYRFACEGKGVAAAVAPVIGNMPLGPSRRCESGPPASLLAVNAVDDPVIPFEGEDGQILSVPDSTRLWSKRSGCAAEGSAATPEVQAPPWAEERKRFAGCPEGTDVELLTFEGGHIWPTAKGSFLGFGSGGPNPASEEIWKFLAAHPRPAG